MSKVAIIKDRGLENILRNYKPAVVEYPKLIITPQHPWYALLRKYEGMLNIPPVTNPNAEMEEYIQYLRTREDVLKNVRDVLSPDDFAVFIPFLLPYESRGRLFAECTGLFLSRLVDNSYHSDKPGYTSFSLNLPFAVPIRGMVDHLTGSAKRPLQIFIQGDVDDCGYSCSFVKMTLEGRISGTVGIESRSCEFTLLRLPLPRPSPFGNHCTYRIPRPDTPAELEEFVGGTDDRNRVIVMEPDGSETIVKDCSYNK